MTQLLPFFIVLFAGLFFSEVFSRLHLPWVIALILAGIFIGPFGFELIAPDPTLSFLGEIGLVFLMFMAGLETRPSTFVNLKKSVFMLALLNGLIPFIAGAAVGYLFGYGVTGALLLGVVFISSSIAVIIPSLQVSGLLHTRVGRTIVTATIFEDVASLLLLSVLLQTVDPVTTLPLPVFYLLLFLFLFFLKWAIPKVRKLLSFGISKKDNMLQLDLQVIFVLLIGIVLIFKLLGLHAIIAGFFAGFALSDTVTKPELIARLRTISYGIFIPIFFVVIGMDTDLSLMLKAGSIGLFVIVLVAASVGSKFISGFLGGRLGGFSRQQSGFIGAATIPQLSTTVAVAFSGVGLGLFDQELATAMVVLSIVTTLLGPLLVRVFRRSAPNENEELAPHGSTGHI